ncbi:hypothetical protein AB4572_02560 [Vibrio splendidus]
MLSMMPDVKSTSTINVDVREWNTQAKNKRMDLFRERGFSDEFVELFSTEITRLSAAKDAEHNAKVLMYKDEADLANELILKTEDELELAGVKVKESNTTISLKDKEITKLKTELVQSEKNCEGIEKRLTDEIGDLQDKLNNQKIDLDKAQSELAKTEIKLENQETLISNLGTQLNECRNKISELSDTVTQKSGEIIRFETQAGSGRCSTDQIITLTLIKHAKQKASNQVILCRHSVSLSKKVTLQKVISFVLTYIPPLSLDLKTIMTQQVITLK